MGLEVSAANQSSLLLECGSQDGYPCAELCVGSDVDSTRKTTAFTLLNCLTSMTGSLGSAGTDLKSECVRPPPIHHSILCVVLDDKGEAIRHSFTFVASQSI